MDSRGFIEEVEAKLTPIAPIVEFAINKQVAEVRATKDDMIDPAVGLKVKVRLGDRIEAGMVVAELHINRTEHLEEAIAIVNGSMAIDELTPQPSELIYDRIRSGRE